jgi:hypothetical protein
LRAAFKPRRMVLRLCSSRDKPRSRIRWIAESRCTAVART